MEAVADFIKAFNPNQPRDPHGRFGQVAASAASAIAGVVSSSGNASHVARSIARVLNTARDTAKGVFDPSKFKVYAKDTSISAMNFLQQRFQGGHSLSQGERLAVESYTHDSDTFNGKLRKSLTLDNSDHLLVTHLDSALSQSKADHDLVVWRGFGGGTLKRFASGDIVHDKGYVSTSVLQNVARNFIRNVMPDTYNEGYSGGIAKIYVKQGANVLVTDGHSTHDHEQELILPRDSKFRLVKRDEGAIDYAGYKLPLLHLELL